MPEVPLEDAQETIEHHAHEAKESWIMGVALTAAILAASAAVTALLAEHHANEAMITQIQASDKFNEYQADSIKRKILEIKKAMLAAQHQTLDPKDEQSLAKYAETMPEIKKEADEKVAESAKHLHHHHPLSFGVTMFQVAIAVGAISVLTKKKPFWFVAIAFGVVGVVFLTQGLML